MSETINFEELQQKALCNWCHNPMTVSEEVTEANLVDTGKTFANGSKAYALYCSTCLKDEMRKNQPKSVIDPKTGQQTNIEDLPAEPKPAAEPEQQQEAKPVSPQR